MSRFFLLAFSLMGFYLSIPLLFLKFWYIEATFRLIRYFFSLNHAVLSILSLPLMITTFFKPLKNEYRSGLVLFSLGMGIVIKSVLIFTDLIIYLVFILLEIAFLILFISWPILSFAVLFIKL